MLGVGASAGAAATVGTAGIIAGRRICMAGTALVPIWVADLALVLTWAGDRAAAVMAAADTVVVADTAAVDAAAIIAEQATTTVIIMSRGARIIPGSLSIEQA